MQDGQSSLVFGIALPFPRIGNQIKATEPGTVVICQLSEQLMLTVTVGWSHSRIVGQAGQTGVPNVQYLGFDLKTPR